MNTPAYTPKHSLEYDTPDNITEISTVILSGGKSSRMGEDKARLKIDGMTFVDRISKEMEGVGEILLSVQNQEDYPEVNLPHITDIYPGCGPMSGIHSALYYSSKEWVFVIACDMPFVERDTALELLEVLKNAQKTGRDVDAVIPVSEDGRLQVLCALYHKRCFSVFSRLLEGTNYRMRDALKEQNVIYVPTSEFTKGNLVFRNINTQKDYKEKCL